MDRVGMFPGILYSDQFACSAAINHDNTTIRVFLLTGIRIEDALMERRRKRFIDHKNAV